jgi:hypothetical protein
MGHAHKYADHKCSCACKHALIQSCNLALLCDLAATLTYVSIVDQMLVCSFVESRKWKKACDQGAKS